MIWKAHCIPGAKGGLVVIKKMDVNEFWLVINTAVSETILHGPSGETSIVCDQQPFFALGLPN